MDLTIDEVAEFLQLSSEQTVAWTQEGVLPAYKLGEQYRFSSVEVENWLLQHRELVQTHQEKSVAAPKGAHHFGLYRALHQADVLIGVSGRTKKALFQEVSRVIGPQIDVDAEMLSELLLDREKLMSTGIGSGIAVPHCRERACGSALDRVFVVYPKSPIFYGALDGQDVHTLFFLFARSDRSHLQLLAKLSHLAASKEAVDLLQKAPSKSELLEFLFEWEGGAQ